MRFKFQTTLMSVDMNKNQITCKKNLFKRLRITKSRTPTIKLGEITKLYTNLVNPKFWNLKTNEYRIM